MATELEINIIERVAMGDIFRRRAMISPKATALVEERNGERLSLNYQQFNDLINKMAHAYRGLGMQPGDKIALACPNSIEFMVCLFACMKGGFVAVPLNFVQNPKDIVYTINHAEARMVVVEDSLTPSFDAMVDQLPLVERWIQVPVTGKATSDTYLNYLDLAAEASAEEVMDVIIRDRDIAQIMYTSGTTSNPKGVMTSHLALFMATMTNAIEMHMEMGVVGSSVMPLFHVAQQILTTTYFHLGGTAVIFRGYEPAALLKSIQDEKIAFTFLLPLMWKGLLEVPDVEKFDYSSLKKGFYGMAPMDQPSLERLKQIFDCPFELGSGQTELTPIACVIRDKWGDVKKGNYWGEAALTVDQAIMDENGNILPDGETGEIVWRSPQVMNGYYKNEEATEAARAFGWHHSGDLGYYDEDRQLMFVDRKKDMVKTGGENVPSVKVERVIMSNPKVAGVAIVGLPHNRWTEAVTAFVVPKDDVELTEDEIFATCKEELGGFEVPKGVVFVDEIPSTATGKFQKHRLRTLYEDYYND